MRVEDTDAARSTDDSQQIILDGLRWLGLEWDEGPDVGGDAGPYCQSERGEIYQKYLAKLEKADAVYEDEGAIRFRVPEKDITVNDLICGDVTVNLKEQGSKRFDQETKQEVEANPDIVIRRPDGSFIFHFCNVVDDLEMAISHVIRGEDHLSNTPKHIALFEAFGADIPTFAHIPLNLNPNGAKMSKRDQGALIHEYIEEGFLADALNNYMALLGWSDADDREIFKSLDELLEAFDLNGVNKSNSKFDFKKCLWVNAEHIKAQSPESLLELSSSFLKDAGIDPDDDRVLTSLELARERAEKLADIPSVIAPAFVDEIEYDDASVKKVTGKDGIAEVVNTLADYLDKVDNWKVDNIKGTIKDAAASIDAKMGAFMLPCRVATMGSTAGADLVPMLELIGKEKTVARVRQFAEKYL